jgi:hypothetical protein
MASVYLPVALEPFLPFVRKAKEKRENACFDSYAQLVTFAAALGFARLDGGPPPAHAERSNAIDPIAWEYFSGDRQQTVLQFIGLIAGGGTEIVNDPDRLCRVVEDLAAEGANELRTLLRRGGDASFHIEVAELLVEAVNDAQSGAVTI